MTLYYVDPRDGKIYSTDDDRGYVNNVVHHDTYTEIMLTVPDSGEVVESVVGWNSLDDLMKAILDIFINKS